MDQQGKEQNTPSSSPDSYREPPTDIPKPDALPKIHPLRTYEDDIQQAISHGNMSMVKIVAAQTQKTPVPQITPEESASTHGLRNILLVVVSLVLILGGVGTFGYWYLVLQKNPSDLATPTTTPSNGLIKIEAQSEFSIDNAHRRDIISNIAALVEEDQKLNSIKEIKFTLGKDESKAVIDTQTFLERMETRIPAELLRTLEGTFMFAIHSYDGNQPFIILKARSYENAYAGMLEWERTLTDDLGPLFFNVHASSATSTASSTLSTSYTQLSTISPELLLKPFVDGVFRNKDARILKDANGKNLFLYSFAEPDTIVITTNESTLREVFDRLKLLKLVR